VVLWKAIGRSHGHLGIDTVLMRYGPTMSSPMCRCAVAYPFPDRLTEIVEHISANKLPRNL